MRFLIGLGLFVFCAKAVYASACCSGGANLPSIILNDDRWSLRNVISNSFVVGDVRRDGKSVWRSSSTNEQLTSLTSSFVYRIGDRWQTGLRIPFRQRRISSETSWGISDVSSTLVFEPWPLYTYSSWRPRFFMIGGMSFPTGTSTYETSDPRLNSYGSGFYSPSLSLIFSRNFIRWDYVIYGEARYQFSRKFDGQEVDPGWIFGGKIGGGYSFLKFRVGASAGPSYEQEKIFSETQSRQGEKLVWDTQLDFSYLITDRWSSSLSYNDQSLLGPARNVSLERSLALGLTYHGI